MRNRDLMKLMEKLEKLTRLQRQKVMAELVAGESQSASVELIEKHGAEGLCCPHCTETRIVRNGRADGLQRYKCRDCSKTFNALTGTALSHLRLKGKWLDQASVLRDGLSLTKASRQLGVARTTAFRWRHRFLAAPKAVQAQLLNGIAEADETFFLRSNKGQRGGLTRKPRHRGGKAEKPGLSNEQVPVLVARDRTGATANFILEADDSAHIVSALQPILAKDAILCTDGSRPLAAAARKLAIAHRPVNLKAGIRVIAGVYHVQNVNAYDSRLKLWLSRFKGVATKYLDSYLGWFRALDRSPGLVLEPAPFLAMSISQ